MEKKKLNWKLNPVPTMYLESVLSVPDARGVCDSHRN